MACSAASSLSSVAYPQSLQQLSFCKALDSRQFSHSANPNPGLRRQCRKAVQLSVKAISDGTSSSSITTMRFNEGGKGMHRRALVALITMSTHIVLLPRCRADVPQVNESKEIRLDMLHKIEDRLRNASTKVVDTSSESSTKSDTPSKQASATSSEFVNPTVKGSVKVNGPFSVKERDSFQEQRAVAAEVSAPLESSSNGIGFLNNLGVAGSGVLGGLYWLERQAKSASDSALQDAASKLKARDDALVSLKEQLEGSILAEKKQALKESEKAQEERAVLLDQLLSAKTIAEELQRHLDGERSVVQNLEMKVEGLRETLREAEQHGLILEEKLSKEQTKSQNLEEKLKLVASQIGAKRDEVAFLQSELKKKEKVSEELSSQINKISEALVHANDRISELEREKSLISKDLELKETAAQELNNKLAVAFSQSEESERQLLRVQQELDSLKISSREEVKFAESNLALKEEELQQLTLRLVNASNEADKTKTLIGDLKEEINVLKCRVAEENAAVERLTEELNVSLQKLEATRAQVGSFSQELTASRELKEQLDRKIADLRKEADANMSSLQQALTQEQTISSQINKELDLLNQALDASRKEATIFYQQLKELEDSYEKLKEDFILSKEAVEVTEAALNKERELAATTKRQLESSRRTIAEAKDNIIILREDVERAKEELDNVNKEVSSLNKDLEIANIKVATLEAEKSVLTESLNEERERTKFLYEKASQVDVAVAKLSKDKETSAKRAKKLEGDLASAKGEMLRLKKQITTMDSTLEEAKSRVQSIAENPELKEQSVNAAEISSDMESIQTEISNLQKSMEAAEISQAEAEAAVGSLQSVLNENRVVESAVRVLPNSLAEGNA